MTVSACSRASAEQHASCGVQMAYDVKDFVRRRMRYSVISISLRLRAVCMRPAFSAPHRFVRGLFHVEEQIFVLAVVERAGELGAIERIEAFDACSARRAAGMIPCRASISVWA